MTKTEIIQILAGFGGTIGFAVLFNIRGRRLALAALGGLLSWFLYVVLGNFIENEVINYFLVSFAVSIYAEIMARVIKTPTTTFITTALIPLIPGGSLYYTMANAFSGNLESFLQKGIYTLELASALALGIIVSTTITQIFYKIVYKKGEYHGKEEKI